MSGLSGSARDALHGRLTDCHYIGDESIADRNEEMKSRHFSLEVRRRTIYEARNIALPLEYTPQAGRQTPMRWGGFRSGGWKFSARQED
ncbi:MAG TPA: hypothetical protein VK660_00830 [Xanthomonadaceae bacterium]|nr:hypothetical protein [Xanthomonadaceae bacterium]